MIDLSKMTSAELVSLKANLYAEMGKRATAVVAEFSPKLRTKLKNTHGSHLECTIPAHEVRIQL